MNYRDAATPPEFPFEATLEVRDRCLCFRAQRAARVLARRFDAALKPVGLTNGQFSLLMALNRPNPARIGAVAEFLAMDRTTLTAALKVLMRRGFVETSPDPDDARGRRVRLTAKGHARLIAAMPLWRAAHDALDQEGSEPAALRSALDHLSRLPKA